MTLKAFSEYKAAHDDAKKQAEVDATAARLAGQAPPDEGGDGGGDGSGAREAVLASAAAALVMVLSLASLINPIIKFATSWTASGDARDEVRARFSPFALFRTAPRPITTGHLIALPRRR